MPMLLASFSVAQTWGRRLLLLRYCSVCSNSPRLMLVLSLPMVPLASGLLLPLGHLPGLYHDEKSHHHLQFCQGSTVPGFIMYIYIHSVPCPSPCISPLHSLVNLWVPPLRLCPLPNPPASSYMHLYFTWLCIHLWRILPLMLY